MAMEAARLQTPATENTKCRMRQVNATLTKSQLPRYDWCQRIPQTRQPHDDNFVFPVFPASARQADPPLSQGLLKSRGKHYGEPFDDIE